MRTNFLRAALAEESRAYGFTIAFWGSGAVLINEYGVPQFLEGIAYGAGAVIGFGLITLYAYRNTLGRAEYDDKDLMVLSMVHYIAALIPIAATYAILELTSTVTSFLLSGMSVSIFYNLGMLVEEALAEEAQLLEDRLYDKLG